MSVLEVFYEFCGRASNLFAKLSTIWRGFQLAWDIGYRHIIIESDSQAA